MYGNLMYTGDDDRPEGALDDAIPADSGGKQSGGGGRGEWLGMCIKGIDLLSKIVSVIVKLPTWHFDIFLMNLNLLNISTFFIVFKCRKLLSIQLMYSITLYLLSMNILFEFKKSAKLYTDSLNEIQ